MNQIIFRILVTVRTLPGL